MKLNESFMNDDIFMIQLPEGFTTIINSLIASDWLISIHNVSDRDRYNPTNYLYNKEMHNIEYRIFFDRNILSYILSAYCQAFCPVVFPPPPI